VAKKSEGRKREAASGATGLYYVLGTVAVVGVAVLGYSLGQGAFGSTATEPVELQVESDRELVELAQPQRRGDPEARVRIIEFGDYQCPGCASFARQVKPMLDLNLVESGQARFEFYDFPLTRIHPHAFVAARAARCAGDQDAYWRFHDALFANQSQWSSAGNPVSRFLDYAEELGLDRDAFEACVKSDRHAETVTANMRLGEELGVNGTPTVMVSEGRGTASRLASFDYETIAREVERILGEDEEESGQGEGEPSE